MAKSKKIIAGLPKPLPVPAWLYQEIESVATEANETDDHIATRLWLLLQRLTTKKARS